MLTTTAANSQTISPDHPIERAPMLCRMAQTLLNIAGLGAGDRVLYHGTPDETMAAAITGRGARLIAGGKRPWPGTGRCADAALGCIADPASPQALAWLRRVRHRLRPGGRLVMWMMPGPDQAPPDLGARFHDLSVRFGLTSTIVGRLPADGEPAPVVATGILK